MMWLDIEKLFNTDTIHYHAIVNYNVEYEEGQQIYMSYGKDTNLYLLCNYGFCFEYNKYDYVRVTLNELTNHYQKSIFVKLYKECGSALQFYPDAFGIKIYYQSLSLS